MAITKPDASGITFTPAGTGGVKRLLEGKLRESVSVLDFGAVGDGITDDTLAIQAAINYVKNLPEVPSKPAVFFPGGRYLITATLQLGNNISLVGEVRDIGYWYGFNHSSELIASGSLTAMIDVTGSNIYIGYLGFYGNNSTDYCLYTAGAFGRASSNTFEHLSITLCKKTGIYLNAIGITKMNNLQISGCLECAIDGSGWGDADLDSLYINTINQDSVSTANEPSSSVPLGVGIRIRANVATGAQSANINIRGGKIEFCRIGILINAGQGINISGINFDTCRRAAIYINSDNLTAYPNIANSNLLSCTSIQITGNRFVGGLMSASQTPSSHIFAANCRYVTISGNGFKRSNDTAIDFGGFGGAQGPSYGIYLYNAEQCTVTGNDLYGAALTNCIRIEHATPAHAQHTVFSNNLDGTEVFNTGMLKTQAMYGSINFSTNSVPNAKNTTKAWVRFDGSSGAPVIKDSFGIASVIGAGGTYTVTGSVNWGVNAAVQVSARNWFGASDNANYGAVTSNQVTVYSTTAGALSSNGDITVMIFAA